MDYREVLARGAGGGELLQTALLHQQDQIWRCQTLCLEQYLLKYFLVLHNNKILFFTASKCLTATISANTDNTADMPVRGARHLTTCRPGCSRTSWVSQSSSIDRYEQRQNPEPQNLMRKDITGDVEKSVSILFDLLSPPLSGKPATASHDSPSHDTGLRSAALDTEYQICSGPRLLAITQKSSQTKTKTNYSDEHPPKKMKKKSNYPDEQMSSQFVTEGAPLMHASGQIWSQRRRKILNMTIREAIHKKMSQSYGYFLYPRASALQILQTLRGVFIVKLGVLS